MSYRMCENAKGIFKIQVQRKRYECYQFWRHFILKKELKYLLEWTDCNRSGDYCGSIKYYTSSIDAAISLESFIKKEEEMAAINNNEWTCKS